MITSSREERVTKDDDDAGRFFMGGR